MGLTLNDVSGVDRAQSAAANEAKSGEEEEGAGQALRKVENMQDDKAETEINEVSI